jgi:hypothetical protein
MERVGESQRRRARTAASLEATRGSCQSKRWCRQSGSGGERRWPATASSCWRLGQRRGTLGKASRKEVKRWASSGVTRGGQERQGGLGRRGTAASGGTTGRGRTKEEGGGARG